VGSGKPGAADEAQVARANEDAARNLLADGGHVKHADVVIEVEKIRSGRVDTTRIT
jgi:hypothetical protein